MTQLRSWLYRFMIVLVVLGIPCMGVSSWLGGNAWTAWRSESEDVTGVVPVRRDGSVYFVVSGHSERTFNRSKGNGVSTEAFPRLTSWRADGERVTTRVYSPVFFRFSYVDEVVRAVTMADGRVWVVSTEADRRLHAVNPVTLADELDQPAIVARIPALAPGVYHDGSTESPVKVVGKELVMRLVSGPWLAVDPKGLTAREVPGEEGSPEVRGSAAIEKIVWGGSKWLEPRVPPVFDLDGNVDATVGYVTSQTSLERETAGVKVTRWDLSGAQPTEGWTATLADVHPDCCQVRVWRADGTAFLWYEHWLIALDDATGATRWVRRL